MHVSSSLPDALQAALQRDLRALLPELILIGTMVGLLLARLFRIFDRVHLLPVALGMTVISLGVALHQQQTWASASPGDHGSLFGHLLIYDALALYGRVLLLCMLMGVQILCLFTGLPDREDSADFVTLLLGSTLGMMLMLMADHLLMVFLAIEMASVPSYALAGFLKGRRTGSEAALKYVIFGAASAGVMLYGISLITASFGTGGLPELSLEYARMASTGEWTLLVAIGTVMIGIGLAFKLSLIMVHFWCPDVFEGAAAEVGAFLSVASKGAALLLSARLLHAFAMPVNVGIALAIVAVLTMTYGNIVALVQTNVKRMLAYSTIAHAGYMLLGLATLRESGFVAVLFYIAVYLLMNLGAFAVVALVRNQTGSEELSAYNGMMERSPVVAITLTVFLVSLLGLPPFAGFAAKFQVFASVLQSGYGSFPVIIVGIAAVNTVISLAYYLGVVKRMMFDEPGADDKPLSLPRGASSYLTLLAGLLLAVGIWWNPLLSVAIHAVSALNFPPVETLR